MSNEWINTAQRMCEAEVEAGIRKTCPYCGGELKPDSINYFEGYHIDGCD